MYSSNKIDQARGVMRLCYGMRHFAPRQPAKFHGLSSAHNQGGEGSCPFGGGVMRRVKKGRKGAKVAKKAADLRQQNALRQTLCNKA